MLNKKTRCLFIHYDPSDSYSEEDKYFINKINLIFPSLVVLTSNTQPVDGVETKKIQNIGYDFGKLEHYLNSVDLNEIEDLYVFNNSCLLVRDPSVSIEYMKNRDLDFWGYTTSTEVKMHVQSYFLYFSNKSIPLLKQFLKDNSPIKNNFSYTDIVYKIELQLWEYMSDKVRCGSYIETHKIFPGINSTIIHADKLLALNPHFPFIKKKIYTFSKTFDKDYLLSLVHYV